MKEPDDPPHDIEEMMRETLGEMLAEARLNPAVLKFPNVVIEVLEAYEKEHTVRRKDIFCVMNPFGEDIFISHVVASVYDGKPFCWLYTNQEMKNPNETFTPGWDLIGVVDRLGCRHLWNRTRPDSCCAAD